MNYFIKKNIDGEYTVEDNKEALLHYMQLEIDRLKLQSPVKFKIKVTPKDRIGYRKKLVSLYKKINKLTYYQLEINYES